MCFGGFFCMLLMYIVVVVSVSGCFLSIVVSFLVICCLLFLFNFDINLSSFMELIIDMFLYKFCIFI